MLLYYPDRPLTFSPTRSNPVSVCIVADAEIVRAELEDLLWRCDEFRCDGSFANADEALTRGAMNNPQIVLLNVEPPGTDGIEWLQQLVSGLRESKVVILTDITRAEWLKESFAAGARGLWSKSASKEELVASLVYVVSGGTVFSRELIDLWLSNGPETGERWCEDLPVLTAQELEILENLAQGLPDKEIVERVKLSLSSLKKRLRELYRKLKVFNRMQAVQCWRGRMVEGNYRVIAPVITKSIRSAGIAY
jgi:DNA-binding NarL/FixJ family response regulator